MINSTDIIKSINEYKSVIQAEFYNECIKLFSNLDEIFDIPDNKYILEGMRIFFTNKNNYDLYNVYLLNNTYQYTKKNTDAYRKITFKSYEAKKNILKQIYYLDNNKHNNKHNDKHNNNYNDIDDICKDNDYITKLDKTVDIIVIFSKKEHELIKVSNKYPIVNLLLGIESLKILEHQNLDRFCSFLCSEKKDIIQSCCMFDKFYKFYSGLTVNQKERFLIFSGSVLHTLGTTYTCDIDFVYYGEGQSQEEIDEIVRLFNKYEQCDYHIIYNKKIKKAKDSLPYLYNWIYYDWPKLIGQNNILEVYADPMHHFHFLGMKLMSVDMTIARLMSRAAPSAFVDLIMLQKINGYDTKPCFPNLSLRQGKITVYSDKMIEKKLNTVKNYFKWWHDINTTIPELKKQIKKCKDVPEYNKYLKKSDKRNSNTQNIINYYESIIRFYCKKYKSDMILNVGDNISDDAYRNMDVNITTLSLPIKNTKYKDNKYDAIISNFTIQYLLDPNLNASNKFIENINSVDKSDTIVIILYLDGERASYQLNKSKYDKYEVYFDGEPLYGIYKLDDDYSTYNKNKVMVYFKDKDGMEEGSIEPLVYKNTLINRFKEIGYNVLIDEYLDTLSVNDNNVIKHKNMLNDGYMKILRMHKIMILQKNVNNKILEGGTYYEKYIKYKKKYLYLRKYK